MKDAFAYFILSLVFLLHLSGQSVADQLPDQPKVASGSCLLQTFPRAAVAAIKVQSNCAATTYGLNRKSDKYFAVSCDSDDGNCALLVPNVTMLNMSEERYPFWTSVQTAPIRSHFILGRIPKILRGGQPLPLSGFNPAVVALPEKLRSSFPLGQWLAVASSFGGRAPDLAVLDHNMSVVARTSISFTNGDEGHNPVSDARLLSLPSGELLLSFSAYSLAESPHKDERDWRHLNTQCIARLHLVVSQSLNTSAMLHFGAHVDRYETRVLDECPDLGINAPGPKKNFGFFEHNGGVMALDWIHPTQIGHVNIDEIVATKANHSWYITPLCFGLESDQQTLVSPPWSGIWAVSCEGMKEVEPSNGPNPIWIEEAQAYLGVGHIHRGCSNLESEYTDCQASEGPFPVYGHHYTHMFFLLSPSGPFRVAGISAEFCMSSEQDEEDCDLVQFVSGLGRKDGEIFLAYGVDDSASRVIRLELASVLESLVPVK